MVTVTFQMSGGESLKTFATPGDNLLEVARNANVVIDAPCSGNASCGKCRVKLLSGEMDSPQTRHITDEEYQAGWRLACVSKLTGDVTIEVPDIASAFQSRMKVADLSSPEEIAIFETTRQQVQDAGIAFGNDLSFLDVTMSEPTLDDTMPDNERLVWAISAQTGQSNVILPFPVLKELSHTLRENNFAVRCVISTSPQAITVYDVFSQKDPRPLCGLVIDLGTTTVSGLLVDMQSGAILAKGSAGNGQIRYGADVINRIVESVKPGGQKLLQKAVVEDTFLPLIAQMCRSSGLSMKGIYRGCIAGNTTMNHLLLGLFSDPVRMEPFVPSFFRMDDVPAADIGLHLNPCAKVIISPNIGSYVGGDITAGALVSMLWNQDELGLFIDLGTNGELVFGNRDFLMSCACSAGPAFEGGGISCGMRATDGAIEACTIDKDSMEPTYHVVGDAEHPVGICGSGIIDLVAELFRCGIISAKGKFVREGRRIRYDEHGMGTYVLAFKEETGSVRDVSINEVDIENFIRTKGAIFSAIMTMLTSLDMDPSVLERVYVAGGIGSGINMKNAVTIGMFPDISLEHFHYIGNTSLTGAYAMLLSQEARDKVDELSRSMTYMELSNEPGYMDNFVAACFLPHTDASLFPSVEVDG